MWGSQHNARRKVAGYVSNIAVEDNSRVRAGEVIATIDDGDFRLAVDAARDKVATQQATVDRIGPQTPPAGRRSPGESSARLGASRRTRARLELDRQQALAQRDFASRQTLEQRSRTAIKPSPACKARRRPWTPRRERDVLKAQQQEARAHAR